MATSFIDTKDLGRVKVFRRRGLKNIRLSINSLGEVRLSIPWYVPKTIGLRYLNSKKEWIIKHKNTVVVQWSDGQALTKDYTLKLHEHQKKQVATLKEKNFFHIYIPEGQNEAMQRKSIDRHVNNFLKQEAKKLLIPFTERLAKQNSFNYKEVRVRNLKSRWGSCNHYKVITLNAALLSLPDELLEYVVIHELVHTRHLNHSKQFWQTIESILPDYKTRRKKLNKFNTAGIFKDQL